ncbi:MAG TPA: hypothetical protein VJ986_06315 [Gaiellaceae bacterium]|nr:hypothetical protein [Gaiellaceae bacterium]
MERTAEQLELVAATRASVRETVAPARARLDGMRSLEEFPWDAIEPGARLGLKTLRLERGGARGAERRLREREEGGS